MGLKYKLTAFSFHLQLKMKKTFWTFFLSFCLLNTFLIGSCTVIYNNIFFPRSLHIHWSSFSFFSPFLYPEVKYLCSFIKWYNSVISKTYFYIGYWLFHVRSPVRACCEHSSAISAFSWKRVSLLPLLCKHENVCPGKFWFQALIDMLAVLLLPLVVSICN